MKRRRVLWLVAGLLGILLAVFIANFRNYPQSQPTSDQKPPFLTESQPTSAQIRVPFRVFLPFDGDAPVGFGGYGYIVFTMRPTARTLDRHKATREAYVSVFEPLASYSDRPKESLLATFWP